MIALLAAAFTAGAGCPDPPVVQYDGKTFTATLCGSGAWAGATLRRAADGAQFDLPAVRVEGETVTVTGAVGPGYTQYFVGTWQEKVPCTTGRHGCVAYGYMLQGQPETWPAWDEWGDHPFADFGPVVARVLDAGGGAALAGKVRAALAGAGLALHDVVDGGRAVAPRSEIVVLYRARWDRVRAWKIASVLREAGLGVRWSVAQWAEAPDAFVVAVGAP